MMSVPALILGFTSCSIVVTLYLLYQLVEILRELVEILRDELNDD